MALPALLKFRLEELAVIKPLCIKNISVDIIVKDADLPVVLRIEYKCFIVVKRIMFQGVPNDACQTFTTVAHVNGLGTEIESDTITEQNHGYDIFSSSIATTDKLVLFISRTSPEGD